MLPPPQILFVNCSCIIHSRQSFTDRGGTSRDSKVKRRGRRQGFISIHDGNVIQRCTSAVPPNTCLLSARFINLSKNSSPWSQSFDSGEKVRTTNMIEKASLIEMPLRGRVRDKDIVIAVYVLPSIFRSGSHERRRPWRKRRVG